MLGKLKAWALGGLAVLSSVLFGLLQLSRAKRHKMERDVAKGQVETLEKANDAIAKSDEQAKVDINEAKQKAARGDFTSLDKW